MKYGPQAPLAFFSITSLFVAWPALSADSAADSLAAEAAARKADRDWAAAAGTPSVDAWMSFYAPNAVVVLPNDQSASGKELVRHAVTHFLALPHLSVAWRPIEVEAARTGDLVFMIGTYELHFDDLPGGSVSDRGRRLEVWRKQVPGTWKCIVDTWSLDAPVAAPAAAAPTTAEGASTSAGSAPSIAQTQSAAPTGPQESGPPAPAHDMATKYGDKPANYEEAIRKYLREHLRRPESIQYREITTPEQGYTTEITGGLLMREKREYGWKVKATINAKDSRDSYTGFKTYTFLFRAEKIVDARLPLPGDEMN
jgi:ketosteroid isomerase-like protein